MSKLDELVKNWLSQGKAREWTEVVELIEKLQEKARLEEREAMKNKIGARRKGASQHWNGAFIETDNYEGGYNKALSDLLNELNK